MWSAVRAGAAHGDRFDRGLGRPLIPRLCFRHLHLALVKEALANLGLHTPASYASVNNAEDDATVMPCATNPRHAETLPATDTRQPLAPGDPGVEEVSLQQDLGNRRRSGPTVCAVSAA